MIRFRGAEIQHYISLAGCKMVDFKSTGRFETVGSEVTEVGRVYQMAVDE